jgi:hypothetical protein
MSTPLRPPVEFRRDLLHYVDDRPDLPCAPRTHPITYAVMAAHFRVSIDQVKYWHRAAMKKLRWMVRATALVEWAEK